MEKKRVAVMTWYTYRNYGTVLQAGALCHILRNLGYAPDVIRYRPQGRHISPPVNQTLFWLRKGANKLCRPGDKPIYSSQRDVLFEKFLAERIAQTESCQSSPELKLLCSAYDAFVCGSDQIWSLNGFDDNYFLPFVENAEKKIAYAPSLGRPEFRSAAQEKRFADLISSFRHLSVRETQSASLIGRLTGKQPKVVLDPTLLMDSSQWDAWLETKAERLPQGKYILCYFLGDSCRYKKYVQGMAAHLKLPYYVIPMTQEQTEDGHAVPFEVGPEDFVSLIRNAGFVCTDSFHATAFSVTYNVPFCVFDRFRETDPRSQNMRLSSFLEQTALEKRRVDPTKCRDYENVAVCDFTEANRRMEALRRMSEDYLSSALREAVNAPEATGSNMRFPITEQCCGCGACAAVCPAGAIRISEDSQGFLQCFVDETRCLRCGKCTDVCPMVHVTAGFLKDAKALYAAQSSTPETRRNSSSGGIGAELALAANKSGSTVFGCVYDRAHNRAKHISVPAECADQLSRFQGSKYIQSSTEEAMTALWRGELSGPIAFFGTPCQVAAVDKLLRKRGLRDKALLVDLICQGMPSVHLWDRHLQQIDAGYKTGKHPAVSFRYKDGTTKARKLRVEGDGKVYVRDERKDDFYAFFRRKLCHMGACYDCPYRERSGADLRLGDYWRERFEKDREMHSMVIANTGTGVEVVAQLRDQQSCTIQEYPLQEYWLVQFPDNIKAPEVREQILRDLRNAEGSLSSLRKQYCGFYDTQERISRCKAAVKKLLGGRR